jgi:hypothetical protein
MVDLFMALLSFVESAPRAYRLKASNAAPASSTSTGTIPALYRTRHNETISETHFSLRGVS